MTWYVQHKPINIMMYTEIEYLRNNRWTKRITDWHLYYDKQRTVTRWRDETRQRIAQDRQSGKEL